MEKLEFLGILQIVQLGLQILHKETPPTEVGGREEEGLGGSTFWLFFQPELSS